MDFDHDKDDTRELGIIAGIIGLAGLVAFMVVIYLLANCMTP